MHLQKRLAHNVKKLKPARHTSIGLPLLKDNAVRDGLSMLPQLVLEATAPLVHRCTAASNWMYALHHKPLSSKNACTTPCLVRVRGSIYSLLELRRGGLRDPGQERLRRLRSQVKYTFMQVKQYVTYGVHDINPLLRLALNELPTNKVLGVRASCARALPFLREFFCPGLCCSTQATEWGTRRRRRQRAHTELSRTGKLSKRHVVSSS